MSIQKKFYTQVDSQIMVIKKVLSTFETPTNYKVIATISVFVFSSPLKIYKQLFKLVKGVDTFKNQSIHKVFKTNNKEKHASQYQQLIQSQVISKTPYFQMNFKKEYLIDDVEANQSYNIKIMTGWKGVNLKQNNKNNKSIIQNFLSFLQLYKTVQTICNRSDKQQIYNILNAQKHVKTQWVQKPNQAILRFIKKPMIWVQINSKMLLYIKNNYPKPLTFQIQYDTQLGWIILKQYNNLRIWQKSHIVNRVNQIVKICQYNDQNQDQQITENNCVDEDSYRSYSYSKFYLQPLSIKRI